MMAFGDFFSSVADRLRQGPFRSAERDNDRPNLSNGGSTGYHPISGKAHRARRNNAGSGSEQGAPQGFRQAYQGQGAPQAAYQQSYLGNPPQGGFQQGYPGPQTGFQQGYPGPQTGFQQGYPGPQTGFQQGYPASAQPANGPAFGTREHRRMNQDSAPQMGSGYQGAFEANSQASRAAAQSFWPDPQQQTPYQSRFAQAQQPMERNRRFGREEPEQMPQQPSQDNISYMPNVYRDEQGEGHHHVERLTQPMSASTCYRLIEFMRNQESVIVNTELIPDERERQRCLDILFGAAYAMDCTFTRISVKSIYLIAPRSVAVISYESIRQMNEQDAAMRWPNVETERPAAFRGFRAAK